MTLDEIARVNTTIEFFPESEQLKLAITALESDNTSYIEKMIVKNTMFDKIIALLCKNQYKVFDSFVDDVLLPHALKMDDCAEMERRVWKIMRAINAQESSTVSIYEFLNSPFYALIQKKNCMVLFANKKLMRKIAPGDKFSDLLDNWMISFRMEDAVESQQYLDSWLALKNSCKFNKQKTVEQLLLGIAKCDWRDAPLCACMAVNALIPDETISINKDVGQRFAEYVIGNRGKGLSLFWSRVQIDGFDQALANSLYEKALLKADGAFVNDLISRCENADLAKPRIEKHKEFLSEFGKSYLEITCSHQMRSYTYTYVDPAVGLNMLGIVGKHMSSVNRRYSNFNGLELLRNLILAVEQSYAADGLDIDVRAARRAISVKMTYAVMRQTTSVLENPLYAFMRKIEPNSRPLNNQCMAHLVNYEYNRDVIKQLFDDVGIASTAKINGDSFDIDGTMVRHYASKILVAFELWHYCMANNRLEEANTFRRLFMCVIRHGGILLAKKIIESHPATMCAWLKEEESVLSYLLLTKGKASEAEELLLDFAKKQQIQAEIPSILLSAITCISDYDRYADILVKTPVGVAFVCYSILRNGKQKAAQKLWQREKLTLSADDMKAVFDVSLSSDDGLKILFGLQQCFDMPLPPEVCPEKIPFSERNWDITKDSMDLMVDARTQFDWRKISFPKHISYDRLNDLWKHSSQFFNLMVEGILEGTKDDDETLKKTSFESINQLFREAIDGKMEWLLKLLLSKGAVPDQDIIEKIQRFVTGNNAAEMILGDGFGVVLKREMKKAGYSLDGQTQNAEKSA